MEGPGGNAGAFCVQSGNDDLSLSGKQESALSGWDVKGTTMRELPVRLPPMRLERRGSVVREVFYFVVAFGAMFGAALIGFDLI